VVINRPSISLRAMCVASRRITSIVRSLFGMLSACFRFAMAGAARVREEKKPVKASNNPQISCECLLSQATRGHSNRRALVVIYPAPRDLPSWLFLPLHFIVFISSLVVARTPSQPPSFRSLCERVSVRVEIGRPRIFRKVCCCCCRCCNLWWFVGFQ